LIGSSNVVMNSFKEYTNGRLVYNFRQLMSEQNFLRFLEVSFSYLDKSNVTLIDFLKVRINFSIKNNFVPS
jgi:hypothetical protein